MKIGLIFKWGQKLCFLKKNIEKKLFGLKALAYRLSILQNIDHQQSL